MSRFKFRVWDKKNNVMVYDDLGAYCNCDEGMTLCYDDCVLMQCTGLKDFGGTKIYEGDIVEEVISNKPKRFEVVWDESAGMFLFAPKFIPKVSGAIDYYELEEEFGEMVVVGNIYENK